MLVSKPFLKRSRARFLPGPPLITLRVKILSTEVGNPTSLHTEIGFLVQASNCLVRAWCGPGAGLARARFQVTHGLCHDLTGAIGQIISLKDLNIPEDLDNGEVTDGTHVTAGQLALALTPYAQVTDLAVNTAASGNNAAAIQSLDDRVTAELASKLDSSALAPAIAPLATGGPGHHGRAGGRARKQHRRAAELADHGSLQQGRPVGLRRAGGRGGH